MGKAVGKSGAEPGSQQSAPSHPRDAAPAISCSSHEGFTVIAPISSSPLLPATIVLKLLMSKENFILYLKLMVSYHPHMWKTFRFFLYSIFKEIFQLFLPSLLVYAESPSWFTIFHRSGELKYGITARIRDEFSSLGPAGNETCD